MTTTAVTPATNRTGSTARRLLGLLAPIGPMGMACWALAIPYHVSDPKQEWIPAVVAEDGRLQLALWALLLFALTATAGAVVTGLVARRGSYRLGTAGLVLTFAGFSALNFNSGGYDTTAAAAGKTGLDVPAVERILAAADGYQAVAIGSALFIPAMFAGVVLLGVALWRGRTVPRWAAAVLIAAFPVVLVGGFTAMTVNALGWLMMAVGFGAAGAVYGRS